MFQIDYSRSAEKSVAGEKIRQPVATNKGIGTQLTARHEVTAEARYQRPLSHELDDDTCPTEENEFQ